MSELTNKHEYFTFDSDKQRSKVNLAKYVNLQDVRTFQNTISVTKYQQFYKSVIVYLNYANTNCVSIKHI